MQKERNDLLLSNVNTIIEALFSLETLIKLTQEYCLKKEFDSVYYSISNNAKSSLSEERNQYICMLNIALEKLKEIKQSNFDFEKKLSILQ